MLTNKFLDIKEDILNQKRKIMVTGIKNEVSKDRIMNLNEKVRTSLFYYKNLFIYLFIFIIKIVK